jgi:hypothetical protein
MNTGLKHSHVEVNIGIGLDLMHPVSSALFFWCSNFFWCPPFLMPSLSDALLFWCPPFGDAVAVVVYSVRQCHLLSPFTLRSLPTSNMLSYFIWDQIFV